MYRTWAVRRYDNNIATILKTSTLFIWRNLLQWVITCYCFLNKYSKQLFNYAAGIHRRKEDFLKERIFWVTYRTVKDPKPLRNKSWISLVKLVVTIISVISNTKGNRFWSRYFRWDLCVISSLQTLISFTVTVASNMSLRSVSLFLLQEKTEQACQFCDRVNTRRTVKNLESEIIQKTRRIQTEEKKYVHCLFNLISSCDLFVWWSYRSSWLCMICSEFVSLFWNS